MSLTRSVGGVLDAVVPSLARRARTIWSNLNGVPLDNLGGVLRHQMYGHQDHLDGRLNLVEARLNDVRHQMHGQFNLIEAKLDEARHQMHSQRDYLDGRFNFADAKLEDARLGLRARIGHVSHATDHAFLMADSLARLDARGREAGRPIAVVSVLPPLETGIANYTLRTFEASPAAVDIFAPLAGAASYLAASRRLPAAGGPIAVFALEALSAALPVRDYAAVIWVLGNSNHHLPVVRLMRETRHLAPLAPTWVQLHDPVLFNVARFHAEEVESDLAALLRAAVPEGIPGADWPAIATGDVSSIIDRPGLPVRALLAGVPLDGVILHSHAARDLILPDWPELTALQQQLLYLPVMDQFQPRPWTPGAAPRLGTFGYPAASKGTEIVVDAFRRLRAARPGATLVIAGYNAALYAAHNGLANEAGIEVHDNPPMPALVELMRGVDVAVQLRAQNTGESSGIVPQLLSLDVPTITTAIGAFAEYGDAVRTIPLGCGAQDLLAIALEEASGTVRRSEARRRYVETHGARDFCAAVLAAAPARSR